MGTSGIASTIKIKEKRKKENYVTVPMKTLMSQEGEPWGDMKCVFDLKAVSDHSPNVS